MKNEGNSLVKGITLTSGIAIVAGSMIGSGIFIAPSLMAGYVESSGIILLLFIIGGIFSLFGALSYGELAAAMPKAGGQYVFIREAYSPWLAFLYGWTLFAVIQTGTIAAVAVAFAKYLGVFIPDISENAIIWKFCIFPAMDLQFFTWTVSIKDQFFTFTTAQAVAMASILVLTYINCFGIKVGTIVQDIFTFLKILALVILIGLGFGLAKGSLANYEPFLNPVVPKALGISLFAALAVALSKALFAYDAWNTVTFTAEEMKEPQKNLPLSLAIGTLLVTVLYTATTAAYFYMIPVTQAHAIPDNRIAAHAARIMFGDFGLMFIAGAILISTFGCNNGLIFAGARVYYAMARDGLFFPAMQRLNPKYHTPNEALIWQGIIACLLAMSGTYSNLLTYTMFASVLFNVLTVIGLFILRKKNPQMERPYKVVGYPIVPAIYILIGFAFLIFVLQGDPRNSLAGLFIILLGMPLYLWFRKVKRNP